MTGVAGSVAIVTGAASGIGLATCRRLERLGASVHGVDRTAAAGVAEADVRDAAALGAVVDAVLRESGRIDVLVAAAGILRPPGSGPKPLADLSAAEWDAVVDTNLKGVFLANRAVLPAMMRARSGHIINIGSMSGREGRALDSAYSASKAGLIGFTEAVREETARFGIRAHVVVPDAVDTPLWRQNGPLRAPSDALAPDRIAELVTMLLELPLDTVFADPAVAPFRGRRARAADATKTEVRDGLVRR